MRNLTKFIDVPEPLKREGSAEQTKVEPQRFCVATSNGVGNFWLLKYMASFILKYPSYLPSLFVHSSGKDLFMQDPDLILWPQIQDRLDLKHEFLFTFHFGLYASTDYVKTYGKPKTIDELEAHKLIRYSSHNLNPFEEACNNLFKSPVKNEKKTFVEVNSNVTMCSFIKNGLGIGPLSHEHPLHENENLVTILPELVISKDLYANYKMDLDPKHPIIKFVYFLKSQLMQDLRTIEVHADFLQDYIVKKNKKMYASMATKLIGKI